MRKTIVALAMALLLVVVAPFAAAEYKQGSGVQTDTVNDSGNGQVIAPMPRQISADGTGDAEPQKIMLRQITREKIQESQQRLEQARQKYQTAKQSFTQARQRINATKERYMECAGDQSEDCQQVKRETKQNTKQYLLGSADRITGMMEQIKERIMSCEQMSEEEAQQRIAAIDAKITEIEASRDTIDDLNNESDPSEIRNAVQEIKQSWTRSKTEMKRSAGMLINAKIGGVVVKSQNLQERLENAIAKLEETGEDTTELNQLMEQFRERVQNANMHYEQARLQYMTGGTDQEIENAMQEANRQMQQSRNELKEAHSVLAQTMKQMRLMKGGVQALEETAEEEDEDEE